MDKNFADKTVIITGSSSGIGAGVAVEFAKRGANLILTGRNVDQLNNVKNQCIEAGLKENQVVVVAGEITEEKCQTELIENALKNFNQIDILVNNAGTIVSKPALETSMEIYDRILDVNLRAAVSLSVMALPHLIKTKGNIVNISSIGGMRPFSPFLFYCMTKASLEMFTRGLAQELGSKGIRANTISPGLIRSNLLSSAGLPKEAANNVYESESYKNLQALERVGEPEEIADLVMFIASDQAGYLNATEVVIDGGWSAN